MDAYVYRAALLCSDCAKTLLNNLPRWPATQATMEDSDCYPQGPYSNGGGEADCPQHCDHCRVFLDNPLTEDGNKYVLEAIKEHDMTGKGNSEVIEEWRDAYSYLLIGNDGD